MTGTFGQIVVAGREKFPLVVVIAHAVCRHLRRLPLDIVVKHVGILLRFARKDLPNQARVPDQIPVAEGVELTAGGNEIGRYDRLEPFPEITAVERTRP